MLQSTVPPYRENFDGTSVPIVIDNGSFECRVGWATERLPCCLSPPVLTFSNHFLVRFRPLVGKIRAKLNGKVETTTLVGNDMTSFDLHRLGARSPFEGEVVTNFELMV